MDLDEALDALGLLSEEWAWGPEQTAALDALRAALSRVEQLEDASTRRDETLDWLRGQERYSRVNVVDVIELLEDSAPLTDEEREREQ